MERALSPNNFWFRPTDITVKGSRNNRWNKYRQNANKDVKTKKKMGGNVIFTASIKVIFDTWNSKCHMCIEKKKKLRRYMWAYKTLSLKMEIDIQYYIVWLSFRHQRCAQKKPKKKSQISFTLINVDKVKEKRTSKTVWMESFCSISVGLMWWVPWEQKSRAKKKEILKKMKFEHMHPGTKNTLFTNKQIISFPFSFTSFTSTTFNSHFVTFCCFFFHHHHELKF